MHTFLGEICGSSQEIVADFWFPNEDFSLTKKVPCFSIINLSLAGSFIQTHQNVDILPATSNNANIVAQMQLAGPGDTTLQRSVTPALTLVSRLNS